MAPQLEYELVVAHQATVGHSMLGENSRDRC